MNKPVLFSILSTLRGDSLVQIRTSAGTIKGSAKSMLQNLSLQTVATPVKMMRLTTETNVFGVLVIELEEGTSNASD